MASAMTGMGDSLRFFVPTPSRDRKRIRCLMLKLYDITDALSRGQIIYTIQRHIIDLYTETKRTTKPAYKHTLHMCTKYKAAYTLHAPTHSQCTTNPTEY